jgi:hypothetical protein
MESFAVDVDPAQIVQWLLAEEREGRRDYSIYAARSYLREPPPETAECRLGDEEREDIDQVTVIGMLEIAPFAYADGWTLRIRAEDPLGPRTPEDEPVPLEEEEIDLATLEEEFIRPRRAMIEIEGEARDENAKRRLHRLLHAVETDRHRNSG